MFPPGLATLDTSPVSTGFPATAITIGIVVVACLAAKAAGVPWVTMTATLRRTRSAASAGRRSYLPSAQRYSTAMALDIAVVAKPKPPGLYLGRISNRVRTTEKSDHRHCRILCARRERPCCRATDYRDELAPPHSITSSAMESTLSGMVRPSALAVVRLMTNSNLVVCSTGRSAGLAPFRILPV